MNNITIEHILRAHKIIIPFIHNTPILTSGTIDQICKANLFFKCENFQKSGAFKIRGATNALFSLDDEEIKNGVATHSSGNHAAALALAAKWRKTKAYVVMPENSSEIKIKAVQEYGAKITFCAPNLEAREQGLEKVIQETGAVFIHPFNDPKIIAGQGSCALEFLNTQSGFDYIITPVGGGGLLSGTSLAVAAKSPKTQVIGVEPELANDAYLSLKSGSFVPAKNSNTIADGLRTSLGSLTFPIIKKNVSEIITVSESEIVLAMRCIWERMKIIVEPSSAICLGAILKKPQKFYGKKIGIILSGGNVDFNNLPW